MSRDPDAMCPVSLERVGATSDGVVLEHDRRAANTVVVARGSERVVEWKLVYCNGSGMRIGSTGRAEKAMR